MPKPRVSKLSTALITARDGFRYLTVRQYGRNHGITRIRAYKINFEKKAPHAWVRARPGRLVTAPEQVSL